MSDVTDSVNESTDCPGASPENCEQSTGRRYDMVIIGAGLAGGLAAYLAARRGLRVLLVERQSFPRSKVCGCCLNLRAQRLLRQAGLEDGLQQLSPVHTDSMRVRYRGRALKIPMPGGIVVTRRRMDSWLVSEAVRAGAEFRDDTTARVLPLEIDAIQTAAEHTAYPPFRTVAMTGTGRRRESPEADVGAKGLLRGEHRTAPGPLTELISADVVLVCDGLGHPSLSQLPGFQSRPVRNSRIGLGSTFAQTQRNSDYLSGEILMAVAEQGYCGMVETEDQQWNLAAAVDSDFLQRCGSPLACLKEIFRSAGISPPAELDTAAIRGTVPLTRRSSRIAGFRLLLLGDSTGYVEPFTGEGMAWAMTAATLAIPLAMRGLVAPWSQEIEREFHRQMKTCVAREQGVCRALSAILSHPLLLRLTFTGASLFPLVTQQLVRRVNRLPPLLE